MERERNNSQTPYQNNMQPSTLLYGVLPRLCYRSCVWVSTLVSKEVTVEATIAMYAINPFVIAPDKANFFLSMHEPFSTGGGKSFMHRSSSSSYTLEHQKTYGKLYIEGRRSKNPDWYDLYPHHILNHHILLSINISTLHGSIHPSKSLLVLFPSLCRCYISLCCCCCYSQDLVFTDNIPTFNVSDLSLSLDSSIGEREAQHHLDVHPDACKPWSLVRDKTPLLAMHGFCPRGFSIWS